VSDVIGVIVIVVSVRSCSVLKVKLIPLFKGVISSSEDFPQYLINAILIGPIAVA
jgi:hypothetical protein